jgi:hypothetical protein
MKTHSLTYGGGLAAVIALGVWMSAPAELDFDNLAEALDSNQSVTVTCGATSVSANVPSLTYNLSFPADATAAFDASKIVATASLGSAVNGDGNPTITQSSGGAGFILLRHLAPLSKMGGLQCQTTNSYAKLNVRGTDTSDSVDIAAEGTSDTLWLAANQVDNTEKTLFGVANVGATSLISASNLQDGQDFDGTVNGEVVFGGGTSSSRYAMFSKVKYMGTSQTNSTVTLTYAFTPLPNAQ